MRLFRNTLWLLVSLIPFSAAVFRDHRQEHFSAGLKWFEVVHPKKVTAGGDFISHYVKHSSMKSTSSASRRRITRRSASASSTFTATSTKSTTSRTPAAIAFEEDVKQLHYQLPIEGSDYHITLQPSREFISDGLVIERHREGGVKHVRIGAGKATECHFRGTLRRTNDSYPIAQATISTCNGLTGLIQMENADYLIEPLKGYSNSSEPHPHLVYRRAVESQQGQARTSLFHDDFRKDHFQAGYQQRIQYERHLRREKPKSRRRRKRSVSIERNVETLVVADRTMLEYYKNEDMETYLLTVLNMVSTLYHDASIGNAINVVVIRIMVLETEEQKVQIDDDTGEKPNNADAAEEMLKKFCKWQKLVNPTDESDPHHHDVAILVTRNNFCTNGDQPCTTLGLAEVAGMCQPQRSCNVNEDSGLTLAFTIAHELGHNFGMTHDGPHNGCQAPLGERQHVMAPHLNSDTSPLVWSNCSRHEITNFLDRDWGRCLDDEPRAHSYTFPVLPPGAMYDADHQCRLQYGNSAKYCDVEDVCQRLWCRLDNKCVTKSEPAAEGTVCGRNKWCYLGNCTEMGDRPDAIDGEWGSWSEWGECSRTCGGGVMQSERHCDNPAPAYGGRYCIGERKRYRMCNTDECPEGTPSFRAEQCSSFNNVPYKGELFNWSPVFIWEKPCELHCKSDGKFFSVMLRDTVVDGTPCLPGSRDVCINGKCRSVSCDWGIETSAQEDRCGICHGDGTQCVTIQKLFNTTERLGYVEIGRIPQGARNIRVEEVRESTNYIAVQGAGGEFYLNGQWFIQWTGDYTAAGTTFFYERKSERDILYAPGPIKEGIVIYLLFQSENPGVKYEYTMPESNATRRPEFEWKYADWTVCSVTCGGGYQESYAKCMEKEAGLVEDTYCTHTTKPKPIKRTCNTHQCPARWWTGPWQHCSATCGDQGRRKRTVLCIRSLGTDEQLALNDDRCAAVTKPHDREPCPVTPQCPEDPNWITSEWSDSCRHNPCANQTREVNCGQIEGCENGTKPVEFRMCDPNECGRWNAGTWSECSESCGGGLQVRKVTCNGGHKRCSRSEEPPSVRSCNNNPCPAEEEPSAQQPYDDTSDEGRPQEVVEDSKSDLVIDVSGSVILDAPIAIERTAEAAATAITTTATTTAVGGDAGHQQEGNTGQQVSLEGPRHAWRTSKWSKCIKGCGGGTRSRHVKCIDRITQQEQPAEKCAKHDKIASSFKPSEHADCNTDPCLAWEITEWSKCSASCGNGTRERSVSCPVVHKCEPSVRPADVAACYGGLCEQWVVGEWSDCQGCGPNATQRRTVHCVSKFNNGPATECDAESKPPTEQLCGGPPCTTESEAAEFRICIDELTYQECQNFKHLCDTKATPYFRLKCCHTCSLYLNRTFNE